MILTYKPSIKLQKTKEGNLLVSFQNKVLQLEFSMNSYTWELIDWLGEAITKDEIEDRMTHWSLEHQDDCNAAIDVLLEEGVLEYIESEKFKLQNSLLRNDYISRQVSYFSDYSNETYSTLDILETLKTSHVSILGAGAIGSWISYSLVQLGIGKLTIIDNDHIELSNLNRQALYNSRDVGKKKIEVLKEKLLLINPNVNIITLPKMIKSSEELNEIDLDLSIIINCADSPSAYQTSMITSQFAKNRKIACINGVGYNGNTGRIGLTTIPGKTKTWDSIYNDQRDEYENNIDLKFKHHVPISGSISPVSMFIASLHTLEILKILVPVWEPSFTNKISRVNLQNFEVKTEHYYENTIGQ